jgi:hypothetical protein
LTQETRSRQEYFVGAFQHPHLSLSCLIFWASPLVVPGRFPASMSACLHQPRKLSTFTPTREPIHDHLMHRQLRVSSRASCTSRIALSRNSGGYFLGAGMILILSGNQTLRQTRGGSH